MPEIKQDIRAATFVVAANDSVHKNMAASDLVGIEFTRHAEHVDDTIEASVYLIGVRLQYV